MEPLKSDTRSISSHWKVYTVHPTHSYRMSRAPMRNLCSLCEFLSHKDSGATVMSWSWKSWGEVKQRLRERDWVPCIWHMAQQPKGNQVLEFHLQSTAIDSIGETRLHKISGKTMVEELNVSFESYCLSRWKKPSL